MTRRVGIVVFDGVTMLDVSGPSEVLHQVGRVAERNGGPTAGREPYELVLVSPHGGPVVTASGLALTGSVTAADAGPLDTVIVAGGDRLAAPPLDAALLETVAEVAAGARSVASVCTGAFVLADLGLLDDRRATTHWRRAEQLARRYPRVHVEPDAIHVRDGRYITSAGISAGIDLTLALVEEDHGAEVARAVARELVVFMQRPGGQSQFSTALTTPPPHTDPLRALIAAVLADPGSDHTLATMAAHAAVSPRHLTRLFHTELGTTPARWLEHVRLDRARQLLLTGHSVTAAARASGLGSDETLRRVFAKHLGTTPSEYRTRFATTGREGSDGRGEPEG
jgi:transcriptional regulator GlxA family with amidase domain